MTLNDLELQNKGFIDFLATSGCDASLYYSHGGATELLLCDSGRFGHWLTLCTLNMHILTLNMHIENLVFVY